MVHMYLYAIRSIYIYLCTIVLNVDIPILRYPQIYQNFSNLEQLQQFMAIYLMVFLVFGKHLSLLMQIVFTFGPIIIVSNAELLYK